MELCPSASGHARKRAALGRELGGVSLRFSVRREESGWCLQQIKETRIIKRPQSPFIFLLFLPITSFIGDAASACSFPPAGAGCTRPGWGSSLCCWSGCDIARCGDNCASYCLASAGDDQLQTKTMTMGIPFVFPGLDAAEVAAVLFLLSSPPAQPWLLGHAGSDPVSGMLLLLQPGWETISFTLLGGHFNLIWRASVCIFSRAYTLLFTWHCWKVDFLFREDRVMTNLYFLCSEYAKLVCVILNALIWIVKDLNS